MKILNNFRNNSAYQLSQKTVSVSQQASYNPISTPANSNPIKANQLASKGLNFTGKNLNQLYEEYNWYINNDHEKPIKAFLKIEEEPKVMDAFLTAILNTDDRSYQLIDSIARSGKELNSITEQLTNKIGSNSTTLLTFIPNCPYTKAYEKYIRSRYENANTMAEILRIRPDWSEEALMNKYAQLKGNDHFKIGKIPNEFPKENNTYEQIIEHLRPNMQIGYKQRQEIPDLKIGNRNYKFTSFTDGKSDKNVFGIEVPEGKKFIIKMGQKEDSGLNKPFGLGTLSLIDTYLTTNRSKNSAPLRFYDKKNNVSIYSFVEHCPVEMVYKPSLQEVNDKLGDFKKLGLTYNDTVGSNNYFQLEDVHKSLMDGNEINDGITSGEWISVDNDHVTFNNKLHPQIQGLHKSLPNMMGMCC